MSRETAKLARKRASNLFGTYPQIWGHYGIVVSTLDFRSEGHWFPSPCLRRETLPHIVSFHQGVYIGTGNILLGVTQHPIQGGVAILSCFVLQ